MQYSVHVSQANIEQGERTSCTRCMVALACMDAGMVEPHVDWVDDVGSRYLKVLFHDVQGNPHKAVAYDDEAVVTVRTWDVGLRDAAPFDVEFVDVSGIGSY